MKKNIIKNNIKSGILAFLLPLVFSSHSFAAASVVEIPSAEVQAKMYASEFLAEYETGEQDDGTGTGKLVPTYEQINYFYFNISQALANRGVNLTSKVITRVEVTALKTSLDSLTLFLCRGNALDCMRSDSSKDAGVQLSSLENSGVLKSADVDVFMDKMGTVVFVNSDPGAAIIGLSQEGAGKITSIKVTVEDKNSNSLNMTGMP